MKVINLDDILEADNRPFIIAIANCEENVYSIENDFPGLFYKIDLKGQITTKPEPKQGIRPTEIYASRQSMNTTH